MVKKFFKNSFSRTINEPKKLQFINGAVVQLAKNSPVWINFEIDTENQSGLPKK